MRVQISVASDVAAGASSIVLKNKCCAIFTHGSHGALQDTFVDLASLMNSRLRRAITVLAGDFNVDILPDSPSDPYADRPDRIDHQADRRLLLRNFCRLFSLKVPEVKNILSAPGGRFSELAKTHPISRLPVGNQLGSAARLDFALSNTERAVAHTFMDRILSRSLYKHS